MGARISAAVRSLASALLAAAVFGAGGGAAAQDCGLCAREVVTNSALATCFLQRFADLERTDGAAVAVDLTDCPSEDSRGVVEALPGPGVDMEAAEPDLRFLVSRTQLDCLKAKLEEPGIVLDPSARIDLGSCG